MSYPGPERLGNVYPTVFSNIDMYGFAKIPRRKIGKLVLLVIGTFICSSCGEGLHQSYKNEDAGAVEGGIVLSWTPVANNADGTPTEDIAGYYIYYGSEEGQYTNKIVVPNPNTSSYRLKNLGAGTYYFAITAYDVSGNESDYSKVIEKVLR